MPDPVLSKREFICLAAALTTVEALAIDIMLPALPDIGEAFHVTHANDRSLVLMAFGLAFGLTQPVFGPVTDRWGRRAPILVGMTVYVLCSLASVVAPSFAALLTIRLVQGAAAAAIKVCISAAVRDRYQGEEMAQVTSLMMSIFLLVPVFVPAAGQVLLVAGSWKLIFLAMAALAGATGIWAWGRLGESLPAARRRPLHFGAIVSGFRLVLSQQRAFMYGATGMFLVGAVLGMIFTSQQLFVEVYGWGPWYPLAIAFMAGSASLCSLAAAPLVSRWGLQRTARASLLGLSLLTFAGAIIALSAGLPGWAYLLILCLASVPLIAGFASTSSLSMQPLGDVAGTAASAFGLISSVFGTTFSYFIAQSYNGTPVPTLVGMGILGSLGFCCCLIAEGRRLPSSSSRVALD